MTVTGPTERPSQFSALTEGGVLVAVAYHEGDVVITVGVGPGEVERAQLSSEEARLVLQGLASVLY